MCPDWELNQEPFTLQDNAQPSHPKSGLFVLFLNLILLKFHFGLYFIISAVIKCLLFTSTNSRIFYYNVVQSHFATFSYLALFAYCFIFRGHISPMESEVSLNCVLNFHSVSHNRPNCIVLKYSLTPLEQS